MRYKTLFIWVEGYDDEQFFSRLIRPLFEQSYDYVRIIPYANMSKRARKNFLKSIRAAGDDYLVVTDLDACSCVTQRLDIFRLIYPFYARERVQVVVQEIEGWYAAGLSDESCEQLRLKLIRDADSLTKEQFNRFIPAKSSRRGFMNELLNHFSMQTARRKNNSFNRFIKTYLVEA